MPVQLYCPVCKNVVPVGTVAPGQPLRCPAGHVIGGPPRPAPGPTPPAPPPVPPRPVAPPPRPPAAAAPPTTVSSPARQPPPPRPAPETPARSTPAPVPAPPVSPVQPQGEQTAEPAAELCTEPATGRWAILGVVGAVAALLLLSGAVLYVFLGSSKPDTAQGLASARDTPKIKPDGGTGGPADTGKAKPDAGGPGKNDTQPKGPGTPPPPGPNEEGKAGDGPPQKGPPAGSPGDGTKPPDPVKPPPSPPPAAGPAAEPEKAPLLGLMRQPIDEIKLDYYKNGDKPLLPKIPLKLTPTVWDGHTNHVRSVAFTSDSKLVLSVSGDMCFVEGPDGRKRPSDFSVRVWDARHGIQLHKVEGFREPLDAIAISPNGRFAAFGHSGWYNEAGRWENSRNHDVHLWDIQEKRAVPGGVTLDDWASGRGAGGAAHRFVGLDSSVFSTAFSPDGRWLVGAANNGKLVVWETSTGRPAQAGQVACARLPGGSQGVSCVQYTPTGRHFLTANGDFTISVTTVPLKVEW